MSLLPLGKATRPPQSSLTATECGRESQGPGHKFSRSMTTQFVLTDVSPLSIRYSSVLFGLIQPTIRMAGLYSCDCACGPELHIPPPFEGPRTIILRLLAPQASLEAYPSTGRNGMLHSATRDPN
uniref:Uncharacterized protein n=1 Tax=Coccidioides posadasii RMSCC 3488 TaxID=454284 RepID=A0A0J6ICS2_COCPO|nr:hypothetical protein CPAG_05817 [Coccidioides posadasii RMSCC 3488]